ncbi:hypothetical protein [Verrucosispora sp. ts21]|uniref:hypothetical protein n=1 Tax=Verrucosispora sp. ts21 TaxID=2069341 RepID=UPI0011AFADAA|nr:hypothetical protein [Verrucosispora sp. ts21]
MLTLWLAERGAKPLSTNGIKLRLNRLGMAAGVNAVHGHRRWHNLTQERKRASGNTGDLVLPLGWTLENMPTTTYKASAAVKRAQELRAARRSRALFCRDTRVTACDL